VFITTNMLARGVDVPECEFVINYDVPTITVDRNHKVGDAENYLHRIGRTGRFGRKGIAVTLIDRDEDKKYFDQIIDSYSMDSKVTTLTDVK